MPDAADNKPSSSPGLKTAARVALWCGFLTCAAVFIHMFAQISTEATAGNQLTVISTFVGAPVLGLLAGLVSFAGALVYFRFRNRNHPGNE